MRQSPQSWLDQHEAHSDVEHVEDALPQQLQLARVRPEDDVQNHPERQAAKIGVHRHWHTGGPRVDLLGGDFRSDLRVRFCGATTEGGHDRPASVCVLLLVVEHEGAPSDDWRERLPALTGAEHGSGSGEHLADVLRGGGEYHWRQIQRIQREAGAVQVTAALKEAERCPATGEGCGEGGEWGRWW